MAQNSNIEWTNDTWNPWQGCKKVSPGCKWCYMYRDKQRYGQDPRIVVRSKPATFNAPLNKLKGPLVFTCSWSDFFIEAADPWRDEAWDIIRQTPHLTYQILTKRPENIRDRLPLDWGSGWPNVWLGVSVENQEMANRRIPELLNSPAQVRFLSCEPLLGPIDLSGRSVEGVWIDPKYAEMDYLLGELIDDEGWPIHWIIAGGESGPNARPMHPDWVQSIQNQCIAANIPFFFKQWGEWLPVSEGELDNYTQWIGDGPKPPMTVVWGTQECGYYCDPIVDIHPDHHQYIMKRVGKKAAGRLLDGQEWNELPVPTESEPILTQAEFVLK